MKKCNMAGNAPNNKTAIQLAIIILLYLILRIPLMDKALWHDEVYCTFFYLSSSPLIELQPEKDISKETGWGKDWKRAMSYHLPLLEVFYYSWIRLFGDSEVSLHIPVLIAGLLGIIILYFLGRLLFETDIGFMAALAAVFSASHIMYSVQAAYPIFEMLIFSASLIALSKFIITKNNKFLCLLLILNVLSVSLSYYYLFYLIMQIILLWFLRDEYKVRLPYFVIPALLFITCSIYIASNIARGRYQGREWPRNDFKQTVKNIINLPRSFIY